MNTPTDPSSPPLFTTAFADDFFFHGHAKFPDATRRSVTIETPNGDSVCALPHHQMHSADGFSWGYDGRGPTELSRCLLIATLGPEARCVSCAGTARIAWDDERGRYVPFDAATHRQEQAGRCHHCDRGIAITTELVNQFTRDIVTRWARDKNWRTTFGEVRAWLANHRPGSSTTSY